MTQTRLILLTAGLMFMAKFAQNSDTFYITSNQHSNKDCSHQLCQTFQQFINNSDRYWYLENVTLVFLTGYHTLTEGPNVFDNYCYLYNKNLYMVGISSDVFIHDIVVTFFNVQTLYIKNLILINGIIHILDAQVSSIFSVTFIDHALHIDDTTLVQLHNCTFSNGVSHLVSEESQVVLSGNTEFLNNHNSALISYKSTLTLSGKVSFINNTGIRGGAMALYSSTLYFINGSKVSFVNNSAQQTGGAIYIEPDMTHRIKPDCFYSHHDGNHHYSENCQEITIYYSENSAQFAGDNIYGTSLALCEGINEQDSISNVFLSNASMSSVSSEPRQVCLCDGDGKPQCNNTPEILTSKSVHPGETLTIPAVIVGGDYGTTIGTAHTSFTSASLLSIPVLEADHQYSQWIDNRSCTDLKYTIYSKHIGQKFTMSFTIQSPKYAQENIILDDACRLFRPCVKTSNAIFMDLTILPCPSGFILLEEPSTCDCNSILMHGGIKCSIVNGNSYFSWNSTLWINVTDTDFTYAHYCPLHYCDPAGKKINLESEPFAQCAFNRAGRLCGGCMEGYSLAIGSSHCIKCPNSNGLALIIFFAAAGILLVFFINVLDITLSQGLLDGLIFYANIVWTYQSVLLPEYHNTNAALFLPRTFIAWLNLDFGIETCFVKGITAYWKTWLQFVFPFYIWAIVGLMILSARHSRILTKLYGNRAVPVLATLFLLSYMKLLRTVTSIYMFSDLLQYPKKSKTIVWSVDGRVDYFGRPHTLLLVAALIVQIFLWLPYTLTLLLHQKLQKISHLRVFKWVINLKPFFDVHFAPFKPVHRYWFGVLLLARGVLLIIYSSSFYTHKNTNLLLLLTIILILLLYMAIVQPYKNKLILIIQSSFLANILLLSSFVLYAETQENKYTLQTTTAGISTGIVFIQFCGITVCNVIRLCCHKKCKPHRYRANFEDELELDGNLSTNYRAYIMNAIF